MYARKLEREQERRREMFEQAEKDGYLLKSFRDPEIDWFDRCYRHCHPCLVIKTRRKYADLWLDLITTNHFFFRRAVGQIHGFLNVFPHTRLVVGGDLVTMKNFPIERAALIGRNLLKITKIDQKFNPPELARPLKRTKGKG